MSMLFSPDFFCPSRRAVVEGLKAEYDRVRDGGSATWFSIEAPAGWGKTRVVQELYRAIAAEQQEEYWPPDLRGLGGNSGANINWVRKAVYPQNESFNRFSYSLPNFMWWGISCEQRRRHPVTILLDEKSQIDDHRPFLTLAWGKAVSLKKRLLSTDIDLRSLIETASLDGLSVIAENTPGLGVIFEVGKWLKNKDSERAAVQRLLADAGQIPRNSNTYSDLEILIGFAQKIAVPGLPLVIVFDDLYRSIYDDGSGKSELFEFIEALATSSSQILILTLTWPGELNDYFAELEGKAEAKLKDRITRIRHDDQRIPGFPSEASMGAMSLDAKAQIILNRFPKTTHQVANKLAKKHSNPLILDLITELPALRQRASIEEEDLSRSLPSELSEIYYSMWNTNDLSTKRLLALIANCGTTNSNHSLQLIGSYFNWFSRLCEALDIESEAITRLPQNWVGVHRGEFIHFWETDQMTLAKSQTCTLFSEAEVAAIPVALSNAFNEIFIERTPSVEAGELDFRDLDAAIELVDEGKLSADAESVVKQMYDRLGFVLECLLLGIDVIRDFDAREDVLDFSALLSGVRPDTGNLDSFFLIKDFLTGSLVYYDRSGTGDMNKAVPLVGLDRVKNIDIKTLYDLGCVQLVK